MIDYTLMAGILLYIVALRWLASGFVGPVAASAIVTIGSFGFSWIIRAISFAIYGSSFWQLLGPADILAAIFTFALLVVVFREIHKRDDSYTAYAVLGIGSAVAVFYVLPALLRALFSLF